MSRAGALGVQDRSQAQVVAITVALALAACSDRAQPPPAPTPRAPAAPAAPQAAPIDAAPPAPRPPPLSTRDNCATQGAELVYVVDKDNKLFRFDPRKLPGDPFEVVGTLACDGRSEPFSMAVDRRGIAWVLYRSGELFRVSIIDARCESAGLPEPTAPPHFGMGFVSDGPKSTTEKLYIASAEQQSVLAEIDVMQMPPRWDPIAPIRTGLTENPELTGTGDGKLFGYWPAAGGGFVQEIGRDGKVIGKRHAVPIEGNQVGAYAFAHWGGTFYVFATFDGVSGVHAINRKSGEYSLVRTNLPFQIVGAGVSTCAPLLEQMP